MRASPGQLRVAADGCSAQAWVSLISATLRSTCPYHKPETADGDNRLHNQHPNLGFHNHGSQCGPSAPGVPIRMPITPKMGSLFHAETQCSLQPGEAGMRQEVDIRYVATSLKGSAQHLYENIYCQRGQMENLIPTATGTEACRERFPQRCPTQSASRP